MLENVSEVPWPLTEKVILSTHHVVLHEVAQGCLSLLGRCIRRVKHRSGRVWVPASLPSPRPSRLAHWGPSPVVSGLSVPIMGKISRVGVNGVMSKKAICN